MNIWIVGIIGLAAEGLGVAIGMLLLFLIDFSNKKIQGMMMSLTAGVMMSIICFDILPEAFSQSGILVTLIGVIGGLAVGLLLDSIVEFLGKGIYKQNSKYVKAGTVLAIAVALHGIPEGIALGTLLAITPKTGMRVALAVALHSVPEGATLAIPFKMAGVRKRVLFMICLGLGSMMGLGAMFGYVVSSLSPIVVTLAMGFASGVILYIVCEELMPESKEIWNGRLTTVATIVGVILGIILTMGI